MDQVVRFFADQPKDAFMGAVLVARDSEVLFSKGYGMANLELGVPNTPATKFRLASVSKQFTAAAILRLEEQGKLRVGDRIKQYLPEAPAAWDSITFHHLLTHTSGIPVDPDRDGEGTLPSRPGKKVQKFMNEPLEFTPGARFSYSNRGYILLAHLIERISGQTFEEYLRMNIFEPLGMKDSGSDSYAEVIPRRASGYSHPRDPNNRLRELRDRPVEHAPFVDMSNTIGAGSLYSTVEDLHRWTQGLFGGKLLSATSVAKMTTPTQGNVYAYGVGARVVDGRRRIAHTGGIQGFHTQLVYFPDSKVTVAVLANFDVLTYAAQGQRETQEVIASWLAKLAHGDVVTLPSERRAISLDAATQAEYVGVFETPARENSAVKLVYTVTLEGGRLYLEGPRIPKSPVEAEAKDRFFLRNQELQFEFTRDESGKVTALRAGQIRAPRK
jgi:CubicO group peptidase (beta-lactamase class C family)